MQNWKRGDAVMVVTPNRGLPKLRGRVGRKGPDRVEAWPGIVVGPSLLGRGWWNVQKIGAEGRRKGVYAVPHAEIRPRARD